MCGRFVQTSPADRLALQFGATDTTDGGLRPRWNVAPSTPVPSVIDAGAGGDGDRRLGLLHWGFVPSWAKGPQDGPRPINARVEGATTSRLFAPTLTRRRCIVPLDAWYEWTDEGGARQPWLIRPTTGAASAVAGLWSTWRDPTAPAEAPALATVALLTTQALGRAAEIHDRMPLLVPEPLLDDWLTPARPAGPALLAALAGEVPDVDVVRVGRRVNDVRNDGPELLHPSTA